MLHTCDVSDVDETLSFNLQNKGWWFITKSLFLLLYIIQNVLFFFLGQREKETYIWQRY